MGSGAADSQKMRLGFGLAQLLCYPVDVFLLEAPHLPTLVLRLSWTLLMCLQALWVPRLPPHWRRRVVNSYGLMDTLFFLAVVHNTGGRESPYFGFFLASPILTAMANPSQRADTILSGLAALGGTLALVMAEGLPLAKVAFWPITAVFAILFGIYASQQHRRVVLAEERALVERSRRETFEELTVNEYRRVHSDKLITIGRLAANVMHELNNPLAFVRSSLDFLKQELPARVREEPAELMDALEDARVGLERLHQISSDLRSFSRMDDEKPAPCFLADIVGDAVRLAKLRLRHVAKLRVEVPRELPEVNVHHRRMVQVILNLLVNAADALEGSGTQQAEVRVKGLASGGSIILLIEDNGPGFPPEVLRRLFEPFFTTKGPEKGTGLGLSLSRELVEQFGGTLTAENGAEGGARLRIELPALVGPGPN